jgi:hypothetical protein
LNFIFKKEEEIRHKIFPFFKFIYSSTGAQIRHTKRKEKKRGKKKKKEKKTQISATKYSTYY